jgi:folate-binding protein YgfZ
MNTDFLQDFEALRNGAVLQTRSTAGVLALSDNDHSDFLQRMTSNNINALRPGESAVTVLTSPTARVLFVFSVLCRSQELWLLPAPGDASALERHLRGQIFFMDKVKVRNLSSDYARLRLLGPKAESMLAVLGFDLAYAADDAWQERDGLTAVKQDKYDLPGYELLIANAQVEDVSARLKQAGVHWLTNEDAYQLARIEAGRPLPHSELTPEFNPLEAGLRWACADNKGCYTGQEIIARQITYDKVTKTLVKLQSAQPQRVGQLLSAEGREAGTITSVAYHPQQKSYLALAIVKRPYNDEGVLLNTTDGRAIVKRIA